MKLESGDELREAWGRDSEYSDPVTEKEAPAVLDLMASGFVNNLKIDLFPVSMSISTNFGNCDL